MAFQRVRFADLTASTLQRPGPEKTKYRKMKQSRTAASPPLAPGQIPLGACAMKYPTAIWPEHTKAADRVNKPIVSNAPPTISMSAAHSKIVGRGSDPPG